MPAMNRPGTLGLSSNTPQIDRGTFVRAATPVPGIAGLDARAAGGASAGAPQLDAAIESLNLAAIARTAAYSLKAACPSVRFTSGRRSKADQARAMAGNVVLNRKWIEQTYAPSNLRNLCQKWVDENPDKTAAEVATGLLSIFDSVDDAELGNFSKHLSGQAFDVQPVSEGAEEIKKAIRSLAGLDKFLESEGGLVRWHAQF
jgi:hypothetical protein